MNDKARLVRGVKNPIMNSAPKNISAKGKMKPEINARLAGIISRDFTYMINASTSIAFFAPASRNIEPTDNLMSSSPNEELPFALNNKPIIVFLLFNVKYQKMFQIAILLTFIRNKHFIFSGMVNNNKTVVAAMSGGVDSSVAAAILKEEGFKLIGVTMKTWGYDEIPVKESGCCSLEAIYNAANVAASLGFPHYTMDFTERFNETVIDNFVSEYMSGYTPNPCVLCNKVIKWGILLEKAKELGADYVATGHYAQVNFNEKNGRYFISISEDTLKDQTYALWQVSQEALSRTIFPLGRYKKTKIREMAAAMGLKTAFEPDSQEICFVPNNDYRELLELRIPDIKNKLGDGDIIFKGVKAGKHKGYPYYTIGQRKGLNLALGVPVYVTKIDSENNLIYVDTDNGIYNKEFIADEINFMKVQELPEPVKAKVKIRYKDSGSDATVEQISENKVKVIFDEPKRSITPGQSAVFYDGSDIIGGGIIREIAE